MIFSHSDDKNGGKIKVDNLWCHLPFNIDDEIPDGASFAIFSWEASKTILGDLANNLGFFY